MPPTQRRATAAFAPRAAIGEGHSLARRLGMLPGNVCTPDYLADTARDIAKRLGMETTVLGREAMEREKMGRFLCVAQGTTQDPKLIALEYRGGAKGAAPIVLVGKGLCFDSGGISIKPAQGMEWMKFDMCGAAGVLGAMEAIGRMELPINVVGLIGSTTNMPSGEAVKPGDVVQASNGKFIEIINTDAEGRLVLADVLVFAKQFSPAAVIDAATLTGACVIALGHTATGVMGNDDALVQEVLDAGKRSGEPGWPLPLWEDYKELIKSDVADIKNSGGRPAGTITRRDVSAGVRRRLSMGSSRHRGNGVHGIGSRHGAARSDGRSSGNVRRVRSRARYAERSRVARATASVGLGLAAGAVFQRPLGAQVRDTHPEARHDSHERDTIPKDTIRGGARGFDAARQSRAARFDRARAHQGRHGQGAVRARRRCR